MNLVIGKYYRDNVIGRTLQYIGKNGNLFEFIYKNPYGEKMTIGISSTDNDPIIHQLILIEDADPDTDEEYKSGPEEDIDYYASDSDDDDRRMDGGKVRRKKSLRKKSLRQKSLRKKSIRKKSIRKKSLRKKSILKKSFTSLIHFVNTSFLL